MRPPDVPQGAIPLRTYAELNHLAEQFFAGKINLLVLVGLPGLKKSWCWQILAEKNKAISLYLNGKMTAFVTYCELYKHRHKLVVLDDAELLWADKVGRMLLRSLTDTGRRKEIHWHSASAQLKKEDIPQKFTTTSKVCVIANRFSFGNYDETSAIIDRGCLFHFCPDNWEVHRDAGTWFWDPAVYNYIGENLQYIEHLSLRTYVTAWQLRRAKLDWIGHIQGQFLDEGAKFIQKLELKRNFTTEEKAGAFIKKGYGCRATYFNIRKRLANGGLLHPKEPPNIELTGKPPADIDIAKLVAEAEAEAKGEKDEDEEEEQEEE